MATRGKRERCLSAVTRALVRDTPVAPSGGRLEIAGEHFYGCTIEGRPPLLQQRSYLSPRVSLAIWVSAARVLLRVTPVELESGWGRGHDLNKLGMRAFDKWRFGSTRQSFRRP